MGKSIYMFAGPDDYRQIADEIRARGLRMYPILMDQRELQPTDDPAVRPYCFLSPIPREELHPYGKPPGICDATDPILAFRLPYYQPPDLLVVGEIYCSEDVPPFYTITKPYFTELAKWVKARWDKLPTGEYIGPQAMELARQGARLAYLPPGVPIERI